MQKRNFKNVLIESACDKHQRRKHNRRNNRRTNRSAVEIDNIKELKQNTQMNRPWWLSGLRQHAISQVWILLGTTILIAQSQKRLVTIQIVGRRMTVVLLTTSNRAINVFFYFTRTLVKGCILGKPFFWQKHSFRF